ncbi:DUF4906 domain-containing protein [Parabacteroides sp. BX2]|jgi:hypothetical protein|uniref:DUF4906 domain-containing protein n=2 Tax=Parabacteroides TaxID=375288 RepID=A0ABR7E0A7_9BACT|nr:MULTISPECIES: DUF4906 domain-containing protein [Parabacteroides]MBC5643182.1 DUF4906 domain-containing protein [Parabacteroides segnis]MCM0713014.1 DUF4906 domain-containing protein [Parabacteroides sp. TA-V-105]
MAGIGHKLETKGVIMALLSLVLISTGCEDKIDPSAVNPSEGETVEVTLNLGIANEEDGAGANDSPTSKAGSNSGSALEVVPVSDVRTKSGTDIPDQFYNLEIIQYSSTGSKLKNQNLTATTGTTFTASLQTASNCKLLLIARGSSNYFSGLSGKGTLDAVRSVTDIIVEAKTSNINKIATDATGATLADMPYYLLLEDVNIIYEDGRYKIQSPQGKDVRLLLKRLAVKVRLDWILDEKMTADKYTLKEVKLCQVPAHYRLIPQTESTDKWGEVYPSSIAEFVDAYRLTGTELTDANGTQTVWIPANARGISSYSNSPYYRNKTNANPAATYAEFVVDNSEKKERLYYRVYLGGNETDDFNLLENTNYHWTVNINKADYANDPRIQLLDQTPVISTNEQPTANCFMMKPGTNICFNPYEHEAGTDGWNTQLTTNGITIQPNKTIDRVEVFWQTKDAGTSGDLVMGYIVDNTNHQNLVNLTDGDKIKDALIHVKVPVTNGGNAVIAAYSGETVVWSWHLWITDYVPTRINSFSEYAAAQTSSSNGTVHKYDSPLFQEGGVYAANVMMDRDLGARKGGFPGITIGEDFTVMDAVNTFGLLYQWGRKDPFFPSADGTNKETDIIYDGNGFSTGIKNTHTQASMNTAIANPSTFYTYSNGVWNTESNRTKFWNADGNMAPGKKTIYDPCPKGWKVPNIFANDRSLSNDNIQANSIFTNFGKTSSGTFVYNVNANYSKFLYYYNNWYGSYTSVPDNNNPKGGRLFLIGDAAIETKTIYNSVWIPANAERHCINNGKLSFAGKYGHMWGADDERYYQGFKPTMVEVNIITNSAFGWPVRCIQQ